MALWFIPLCQSSEYSILRQNDYFAEIFKLMAKGATNNVGESYF